MEFNKAFIPNGMYQSEKELGVSDSGFRSQKPGTQERKIYCWFRQELDPLWIPRSQEPVVACYKMKARLYLDTSVSENALKRFFRWVPGFLENRSPENLNNRYA